MQYFPNSNQQHKLSEYFENLEALKLFNQVNLSQWKITPTSVQYHRETEHTLSLYLSGGYNTYRHNHRSNKGSPGSLCLMPQGHESKWHVNDDLELLHLYFSDSHYRQRAAHLLNVDARLININELNYQKDSLLVRLINNIYLSISQGDLLAGEENVNELFVMLAKNYSSLKHNSKIKGGLSKQHQSKISSFIADNISQKLTIELLASQLDLSAYHFARLFKESFAMSPANYITGIRVEKSKRLINDGKSLTDIALDAGFCQQSHFTSCFKRLTGYTPRQYCKAKNC